VLVEVVVEDRIGIEVGKAKLRFVGLVGPEVGGGSFFDDVLRNFEVGSYGEDLGFVKVEDRFEVTGFVAVTGVVAKQVLGAVFGADDEGVVSSGLVVDKGHADAGGDVAETVKSDGV